MKGDFTRFTFDPKKRYHGVLQQQGRVQLDADWNEQNQIDSYRTETSAADIIGITGGPLPTPGFEIKVTANQKDLRIGRGHYYVDGILCELETETAPNAQEDLPPSAKITIASAGAAAYTSTPPPGVYLAYLDVWLHHLTAIERPELRESALGGPDHATREKLMAHVKFVRVGAAGTPVNCLSNFPAFNAIAAPKLGKLNARTKPGKTASDACIVNPGAGYRRLENQLYRIEIHQGGNFNDKDLNTNPTFKWSRDNGSITAKWDGVNGNDLTVSTPGRDKVAGFASGQWIELTDDTHEVASEPGLLVQIASVKGNIITVNPGGQSLNYAQFPKNPKIRRWDSPGAVRVRHNPEPLTDKFLTLEGEGGVEIHFESGIYRTGDYWLIPARTSGPTSIGDIEWARETAMPKSPIPQEPHGIRHHYARLALLEFNSGKWEILSDCRGKFAPLTEQTTLSLVGGDGQEATPHPTNPATLVPLGERLQVGVSNGSLPVAGARVLFGVKKGNGRLEGNPNVVEAVKFTDPTGVATCAWSLDSATLDQQVTATLLNAAGNTMHLPVVFSASLSRAAEVSFDPTNCPDLAGQFNVQAAIESLCKIQHAGCATYVVSPDNWKQIFQRLKPNEDAHICFQRGEFKAEEPLVLSGLGHIRLTGAGVGSRVLVSQGEMALGCGNCKSISIEHLSLATVDDDSLPPSKSLSGVLTVRNCPLVSVQNVGIECGAGLATQRTCITIATTDSVNSPLEWVRVQGCDLTVGHGQYGVLVVDAKRVDIEGNRIRTAPLPPSFTLEKQATEPKRAKELVRQLVANGIYRETISTDSGKLRFDVGAFAILLNSTVPHGEWLKLIEQQPPTPADKASKDAVAAYANHLVAAALANPQRLPSYDRQLNHLQSAIGEAPFRNLLSEVRRNLLISREVEVKSFTEVEKYQRTTALVFADRRLLFDSELSSADWQAILASEDSTAPRSNAELYREVSKAAKRIVSDKAYRDRFSAARGWYEGLRAKAAQAVSGCGVVCAGRLAAKVRVERNSIEGAAEAIRVAFSHNSGKDDKPDYAEDVSIRDNNIQLRVPWERKMGRYGLFVGNVRWLTLANNKLTTDSLSEQRPSFMEGIRVWGYFGMVLALRDNVVQDARKGVFVKVEGLLESPNHQRRAFLISSPNWQLTGTWTDGTIEVPSLVKRRDNMPEP
jgi:hypothetical protein